MNYVIGMGQVGTALTEILECEGRDLDPVPIIEGVRTLHIAYPWSDTFNTDTRNYQVAYQPELLIVHSTVPVGTCDPQEWVHSPVRGRHDELTASIQTFTKFFGGKNSGYAASNWPTKKTWSTPQARTTEAGKLWELAQFGLQIRINQAIYEYCLHNDLPAKVVYDYFAATYNNGYRDMGHPEFMRPVLQYVPGEIGGHCVTPGSKLLDHPFTKLI